MKLKEMSDKELQQMIDQLERTSKHNFDKYERWEATQKCQLAKAEQRKRNPIERFRRGFRNLFDN